MEILDLKLKRNLWNHITSGYLAIAPVTNRNSHIIDVCQERWERGKQGRMGGGGKERERERGGGEREREGVENHQCHVCSHIFFSFISD